MEQSVGITGILSVLIAVGFIIFLYLRYLNNQKAKNPLLQNEKETFKYPECPAFFETMTDHTGKIKCKNVLNIGKCRKSPHDTISFEDNKLFNNTKTGKYWKCRWAKECEVPWGGIEKLC